MNLAGLRRAAQASEVSSGARGWREKRATLAAPRRRTGSKWHMRAAEPKRGLGSAARKHSHARKASKHLEPVQLKEPPPPPIVSSPPLFPSSYPPPSPDTYFTDCFESVFTCRQVRLEPDLSGVAARVRFPSGPSSLAANANFNTP